MAIKKRKTFKPLENPVEEPKGLVIVSKPKKPLPDLNVTAIYPNDRDLLRLGQLAQSCGADKPDAGLNAADRVRLLRTSYDIHNQQEQRYRNRIRNRATAITAMCIVCTGSRKLVTECAATTCPLWAFRFGGDPFRGNRK